MTYRRVGDECAADATADAKASAEAEAEGEAEARAEARAEVWRDERRDGVKEPLADTRAPLATFPMGGPPMPCDAFEMLATYVHALVVERRWEPN